VYVWQAVFISLRRRALYAVGFGGFRYEDVTSRMGGIRFVGLYVDASRRGECGEIYMEFVLCYMRV
jgi:hypothetical protein